MKLYARSFHHVQSAHDELQDIVPYSLADTFSPKYEAKDNTWLKDFSAILGAIGVVGVGTMAETSEYYMTNIQSPTISTGTNSFGKVVKSAMKAAGREGQYG